MLSAILKNLSHIVLMLSIDPANQSHPNQTLYVADLT